MGYLSEEDIFLLETVVKGGLDVFGCLTANSRLGTGKHFWRYPRILFTGEITSGRLFERGWSSYGYMK